MVSSIPITNDAMLLAVIGADLQDVVDDTATWLVTRIQDSIMEHVYQEPQSPNSSYKRLMWDGGLIGAWGKEATEFVGKYITTTIAMLSDDFPKILDATRVEYNPDNLQHGNESVDRSADIAQYIIEGSNWDIGGNATMKRDFWSEIIAVVENGELDSQLERLMSLKGIVWQRI